MCDARNNCHPDIGSGDRLHKPLPLSGIEGTGQRVTFRDGLELVDSERTHRVVLAPASGPVANGSRAEFLVTVENRGQEEFVFSAEDMTAGVVGGDEMDGRLLRVFGYAELLIEERDRLHAEKWRAALEYLSDTINASNAGRTYRQDSVSAFGSGTDVDGVHFGSACGTHSQTTYDAGAVEVARDAAEAKLQERTGQLEAEGQANLARLNAAALKKQTIMPGESHGGMVQIQLPRVGDEPRVVAIDVTAGGELHRFRFRQEKQP